MRAALTDTSLLALWHSELGRHGHKGSYHLGGCASQRLCKPAAVDFCTLLHLFIHYKYASDFVRYTFSVLCSLLHVLYKSCARFELAR